ncbi:hypothetical protein V1527DRAFT_476426 [Lipomyces starkeyi]
MLVILGLFILCYVHSVMGVVIQLPPLTSTRVFAGNSTYSYSGNGYIYKRGDITIRDVLYEETGLFSAPWHILLPYLIRLDSTNSSTYANIVESYDPVANVLKLGGPVSKNVDMTYISWGFETHGVLKGLVDTHGVSPFYSRDDALAMNSNNSPLLRRSNCNTVWNDERASCHGNHYAARGDCSRAVYKTDCAEDCDSFKCVISYNTCSSVFKPKNNNEGSTNHWALSAYTIWSDCINGGNNKQSGVIVVNRDKTCVCNVKNVNSC